MIILMFQIKNSLGDPYFYNEFFKNIKDEKNFMQHLIAAGTAGYRSAAKKHPADSEGRRYGLCTCR